MKTEILDRLRSITAEEAQILAGRTDIDREIYMRGRENTVNARKLLASGKLITLRPNTRFIHFPQHRHDYVEVVYMCAGQTIHLVNGKRIELRQGELLMMNQNAIHESLPAEEGDIAVNFIVLPDFFSTALAAMGEEETPLRRFLVDCLCGRSTGADHLHFRVSQVIPVQNLAENLICILLNDTFSKRNAAQMTMALLFLHLCGYTDTLTTDSSEDTAIFHVLQYVETEYAAGSFRELARQLHYNESWLSRQIKRKTGKTYTQLVQDKRLAQAAFLLKNTDSNVDAIGHAVGYENLSYFHRIFCNVYGRSPRQYREEEKRN